MRKHFTSSLFRLCTLSVSAAYPSFSPDYSVLLV